MPLPRNKRIKVLVLTSSFPRSNTDWWARFVLNLHTHTSNDQYEITVIAPHSPGSAFAEKIQGIQVYRYPYWLPLSWQKLTNGVGILPSCRVSKLATIQVPFLLASSCIYAAFFALSGRYHIIHAHWIVPQGLIAVLVKMISGVSVVTTVHGTDIFGLKLLTGIKKFVLDKSDRVTANSPVTKKCVEKIAPKASVVELPMGVDIDLFRSRGGTTVSPYKILFVGRLIKWKGVDYLIRALPAICHTYPQTNLTIIGAGPEEASLRLLARDLSLTNQIEFNKNVSHTKMPEYLHSSSVFVSSSIRNTDTGEQEALGVVIVEAMASRVPVVVTESVGIAESIKQNNAGIVVREKSASQIAEGVVQVFARQNDTKKRVENAYKLVKDAYSWEKIGNELDRIYMSLM